mgnify:CR=1 FL=1
MNEKLKKNWIYWGMVVVGGAVAVRQGVSVLRLWKSGERIQEVQAEVKLAEEENRKLEERLAEITSPEFVEREAREKLGYGREGETMLIVPDQNANLRPQIPNTDQEPNWRKWWKLYIAD